MWDTIASIVYIPWIFTTPYVPSVHCSNLSNISTPDKLLFPLPSAHHFLLSWPSVNIKTSIRRFPVVSLSSLAPRGSNSLLSITECSSPICPSNAGPSGHIKRAAVEAAQFLPQVSPWPWLLLHWTCTLNIIPIPFSRISRLLLSSLGPRVLTFYLCLGSPNKSVGNSLSNCVDVIFKKGQRE